jgi:outer membrane protein OmpA-like peptidoglycan-associated protein
MAACAGMTNRNNQACSLTGDLADRQKCELQACLGNAQGTQVEKHEDGVCVIMCCDQIFESGSDRVCSTTCRQLHDVAEVVKKYPDTQMKVDAHTDCIRSEESNLELSEKQAEAIKDVLIGQGVASSHVIARGWGEAKPVASNATESGRQANRRLTITLLPVGN